jgi:ADP-heptose:LPS heptosyltransferase
MVYHPNEAEITSVSNRFAAWIHEPFLIIQTGGGRSRSWRDWPTKSYISNIEWIRNHYPLNIILTGGWDNEKVAHEIEQACPYVINLCNKTTLEETAALLSRSVMLLSTDTGVLFMAYAIGCPALAILHHASPGSLIGPIDHSAGHEVVELPKPDVQTEKLEGEMRKIRDEDVRDAIRRILERRGVKALVTS